MRMLLRLWVVLCQLFLKLKTFKGGRNAVEATTAEFPGEYNKGANAVEAAVNELPAYAESGAPVVANVPAYGESGAPIVRNALALCRKWRSVAANVPVYGESESPVVNNALPYAEGGGAPAVANVRSLRRKWYTSSKQHSALCRKWRPSCSKMFQFMQKVVLRQYYYSSPC